MKRSLFWKMALVLSATVLLVESALLVVMYHVSYQNSLTHNTEDIRRFAATAAQYFQAYDPYDLKDCADCNDLFNTLCEDLDLSYLYAIRPDTEKRDETYLALGSSKSFRNLVDGQRYTGYVSKGTLTDAELQAFNGDKSGVTAHEQNQFGDMLICYMPVERYFDSKTSAYVEKTVSFIGAEISMDEVMALSRKSFLNITLLTLLPSLAISAAIALLLYFLISRPLRVISERMKHFVEDRSKNFERLPVKGNNEFAEVSASFNTMAEEIDRYLAQSVEMNRQMTELQIARSIQMGLLEPETFSNTTAEVSAFIRPAKDVGGDLYDYLELEDGKICVMIADVSGKGVSAALFMSRAVTLLHQYAEAGLRPSQLLYEYNNHLAAHNSNLMFITTFVGIYDPVAGTLTYSNAGHNPPYLLSDRLTALDGRHGPAAGVFAGEPYDEQTVPFRPGDRLFMYTDGVTEAKNDSNRLFGDEALQKVLETVLHDGSDIIEAVLAQLSDFTGEAPQSDDITMLMLRAVPPEETNS